LRHLKDRPRNPPAAIAFQPADQFLDPAASGQQQARQQGSDAHAPKLRRGR
jgi:hypothetical protein